MLLDVAAVHQVATLPPGYGITAEDLDLAAERADAEPGEGDVALIRTGWSRNFDDTTTYLGKQTGVPGATPAAARWLADRGVVATGADTTAYEQIPAGAGHAVLPVHRILLVESGIFILEHLNLEALAQAGLHEFVFVLAPLRIKGGTGSPSAPRGGNGMTPSNASPPSLPRPPPTGYRTSCAPTPPAAS